MQQHILALLSSLHTSHLMENFPEAYTDSHACNSREPRHQNELLSLYVTTNTQRSLFCYVYKNEYCFVTVVKHATLDRFDATICFARLAAQFNQNHFGGERKAGTRQRARDCGSAGFRLQYSGKVDQVLRLGRPSGLLRSASALHDGESRVCDDMGRIQVPAQA